MQHPFEDTGMLLYHVPLCLTYFQNLGVNDLCTIEKKHFSSQYQSIKLHIMGYKIVTKVEAASIVRT